ncbi:nucleotidyltransferase [Spirosoma foliorum]|uniref:Nucleotidyltransferase n=1 Tax=Spirosoma foliorum TaxID=2710596 RepID=A0A7G5GRX7_9BACT|nr:nucleotidyltransferase [Spirosoma foliorum]QMW01619.1 nucleotidyltransferase [Spirosoma foliorum]
MASLFNPDFQDFLEALHKREVRYVLVGGYSVILHGYKRTTGDMDIWVERSSENYAQLVKAFQDFGMPIFDMTPANFLDNPAFDVFTFGRQPVAIDIITAIKGLTFDETFAQALDTTIDGVTVRLIHYNHLIRAKEAAGRPRDLNDIEQLKKGRI